MIKFEGLRERLQLGYPHPELIAILKAMSIWSARAGHDITITSLNDHDHQRRTASKRQSLHYSDLAVDVVIQGKRGINRAAMRSLRTYLVKTLGLGFDVLFETDAAHMGHLHAEADFAQKPRKYVKDAQ